MIVRRRRVDPSLDFLGSRVRDRRHMGGYAHASADPRRATSYQETSLHAHVMEFLAALDGARRSAVSPVRRSARARGGRELPLCVLSAHGMKTPAGVARSAACRSCSIINGIHAGEVEGKEASMMLMRDILDGTHARSARAS